MAVDCIIVGGGIIGMMTAYELGKQGLKVQILEKGQVGKEASWAGGGILSPLSPWESPENLWPLVTSSQRVYPELCTELKESTGIDPQWIQSGLINFDIDDLDKARHWSQETGSGYEQINQTQLIKHEAKINSELESAILLANVAQVRNPRLLKALKQYLETQGVLISEGIEVEEIVVDQDRLQAVQTTAGKITCKYGVISAGAWSGRFFSDMTLVQPIRGQMLRIEVPADFIQHILLKDDLYIIPRQAELNNVDEKGIGHQPGNQTRHQLKHQQILIGSTLEYGGFDKRTTAEAAEILYQAAIELIPDLTNYPISQQWVGLRPGPAPQGLAQNSGECLPVICADQSTQGLFYNTGHFRNGIVLAPASAQIISDLILNQ